MTAPQIIAATVRVLNMVNHGHVYAGFPELAAGDLVRIRSGQAVIHARVAWDIGEGRKELGRVTLDHWQCAALSCGAGDEVELSVVDQTAVPVAEQVELRLVGGSGSSDREQGLFDFLRRGHYPLYPGLRFAFRPLATTTAGEYEVMRVRSAGVAVDVAFVSESLDHTVVPGGGQDTPNSAYAGLGGLDDVIATLRSEIELPLRRPAELRQIGVYASAGVLICGPSGIGKTSLARAVGERSGAEVVTLSGPSLASQSRAEAESTLRQAFQPSPPGHSPRMVILDDLDYLTPTRDSLTAASSFLGLIQELLDQRGRPVLIATTSRPGDIDPAVKRLGRIGRLIPIPLPGDRDRQAILAVHTRDLALAVEDEAARDVLLTDLAARTSGFVGADLAALCHEAGRLALRRAFPLDQLESDQLTPVAALEVVAEDWTEALRSVTPSAIGGVVSEVPGTSFADVAGLDSTVAELHERLVLPLSNPGLFAEAGLPIERGVLLYGPPGTGKTLLARALANECGQRFLSVRGPELLNRWFGESESAVRELFAKARHLAPTIVFFDEVDALVPRRRGGALDGGAADRVVNQLLAELDGLHELGNVTVVGATNSPDSLDPAVLRPGRLGLHIEVGLPDLAGRRALFVLYLPEPGLAERIPRYAEESTGMSGADIAMVAREARLEALRRTAFARAEPPNDADVVIGLRRVRESLGVRLP